MLDVGERWLTSWRPTDVYRRTGQCSDGLNYGRLRNTFIATTYTSTVILNHGYSNENITTWQCNLLTNAEIAFILGRSVSHFDNFDALFIASVNSTSRCTPIHSFFEIASHHFLNFSHIHFCEYKLKTFYFAAVT